jgi:hypothetical protein
MLRQHWDSAVNEIYAGGTLLRLLVNDGALLDVMRDIGNVDTDLI